MVSALASPILHFVARVVMHTKRDSDSPPGLGGVAAPSINARSLLAGADGVATL